MALNLFNRLKAASSFRALGRAGALRPADRIDLVRKDFSRAEWRRHTSAKNRPHCNYIQAKSITVARYVGHNVSNASPAERQAALDNKRLFRNDRYQLFLHARKGWRSFRIVPGSMSNGRTYH